MMRQSLISTIVVSNTRRPEMVERLACARHTSTTFFYVQKTKNVSMTKQQ
jgi:hypothetical protein